MSDRGEFQQHWSYLWEKLPGDHRDFGKYFVELSEPDMYLYAANGIWR
jgi:hypothetical protein